MKGIWVAVNATTSVSASSRYTVLKLWKSRPAAPMIRTRRVMAFRPFERGCDARVAPPPRSSPRRLPQREAGRSGRGSARPAVLGDVPERLREMRDRDVPAEIAGPAEDRGAGDRPRRRIHVVAGEPVGVRHL